MRPLVRTPPLSTAAQLSWRRAWGPQTGSWTPLRVLEVRRKSSQAFEACFFQLRVSVTTHLMMIDTDYETYASYIECNAEDGYDIPIIQSLGSTEIDPVLLARLGKKTRLNC